MDYMKPSDVLCLKMAINQAGPNQNAVDLVHNPKEKKQKKIPSLFIGKPPKSAHQ